jgi:hypothetical protein
MSDPVGLDERHPVLVAIFVWRVLARALLCQYDRDKDVLSVQEVRTGSVTVKEGGIPSKWKVLVIMVESPVRINMVQKYLLEIIPVIPTDPDEYRKHFPKLVPHYVLQSSFIPGETFRQSLYSLGIPHGIDITFADELLPLFVARVTSFQSFLEFLTYRLEQLFAVLFASPRPSNKRSHSFTRTLPWCMEQSPLCTRLRGFVGKGRPPFALENVGNRKMVGLKPIYVYKLNP